MYTITNIQSLIDSKKTADPIMGKITAMLIKLGVNTASKGYKYLKVAIRMSIDDPESLDLITKLLYRDIAKRYNSTTVAIERSIRLVVHRITNEDLLKIGIDRHFDKPFTNKEFIGLMYTLLAEEEYLKGA